MTRIQWLRLSYRVGAAVDALACVQLAVPAVLARSVGLAPFTPDVPYRFGTAIAASLMLGWTALLLWADRRPLERRGVLPLTVLVVAGLAASEAWAAARGFLPVGPVVALLVLQGALVTLFAGAWIGAGLAAARLPPPEAGPFGARSGAPARLGPRGGGGSMERPTESGVAGTRPDWREHGVRIVHASALDLNTPQTPGMRRAAAINLATAGARKLWAGTVLVDPDAKTGPHHHGHLESVIFVVEGRARMRWGEALEFTAEAGPGDFIFVPPYVPHQELNASADEPLRCVVVRSDQEPVVVNLDIAAVERPEDVEWVDPAHPPRSTH